MFVVRHAHSGDTSKILNLYSIVAAGTIGIARSASEITNEYVLHFMNKAQNTGVEFVIDHPQNKNLIIAEIHCYKPTPKVFHHVLSELTIVIHPDFHGQGIGKIIFTQMLEYIIADRPDILRVELIARESNQKAIGLYKNLGFIEEGRLEKRILNQQNLFEADIPMAWYNPGFKGPGIAV